LKIKNPKDRHYIKSSSFVMAAVFTILCGLSALCLGYFINYFTTGHFVQSTEAAIDAEIRYVDLVGLETPKDHDNIIFIPLDDIPNDIAKSVSKLIEGILVFDHPINENRYAAKIHTFDTGEQLLVGLDITQVSQDFKFMQIMGVLSIIFVMMVVFVAYIISIFVVSNTNKIANTARDIINTGDLSRRVDVGSRWDDLSNMAAVLNRLLDRVQELMMGVRQVSDNIAHDLRTPLTRLHNRIEALEKQYGHEDYAGLKQETDHILNIFNALLRISRIESEKQKSQFKEIDIKDILEDVIDFYAPLTTEKNIALTTKLDDALIEGDRDLLFQAYANLLDNAVKFTPDNGEILVKIDQGDEGVLIEVKNSGTFVDEDDQEKIFNRFYRTEQSRHTQG